MLEQIKYFDTYVGEDTTKKGKDGFLNEFEFINYVNYVMQGNPDKQYVNEYKSAFYKNEIFLKQSKINYNEVMKLFDQFQEE